MGAPYWNPEARGIITGLTRGVGRTHIARAALEGIAFQTYDVLAAMKKDTGMEITELRADGGASVNNFLMQFQADILDIPVVRPQTAETTALGAAYLAGIATGFWKNTAECQEHWKQDREFIPSMDPGTVRELLRNWRKAVKKAF
jgi:glycerol kinase